MRHLELSITAGRIWELADIHLLIELSDVLKSNCVLGYQLVIGHSFHSFSITLGSNVDAMTMAGDQESPSGILTVDCSCCIMALDSCSKWSSPPLRHLLTSLAFSSSMKCSTLLAKPALVTTSA